MEEKEITIVDCMVEAIEKGYRERERLINEAVARGIDTELVTNYSLDELIQAIEIVMEDRDVILVCKEEEMDQEQRQWLAEIINASLND